MISNEQIFYFYFLDRKIIYFSFFKILIFIIFHFNFINALCDAIKNGGYLTQSVTINPFENPCVVNNDLFIPEKITLTLNPGTQLRFSPGTMLAVNGTLIARGTENNRIVLTRREHNPNLFPKWPSKIRLVDEFSVSLGRLQLFYNNKWRGVCANNVNWTQVDTDVACRQLGFFTGNFSFGTWARNDSSYLLFHDPQCFGVEDNLFKCRNAPKIKIGTNICKNQNSVYLKCYGLSNSSFAKDYWWGLEFYNTTYTQRRVGNVETNESTSVLENLDILYAGVDKFFNSVPTIRASPFAPNLVNVTILHSALDATNFTSLLSTTLVQNTYIHNCRGHGINVETLIGRVEIKNSIFTKNYGNGLKIKFLDRRFQILDKDLLFCNQPNVINKYPQIITGVPNIGSHCDRRFTTEYNKRLTLNILEMDIEPEAKGWIEVYDGYDTTSPILGSYQIVNGSFPMGVTSTLYFMYIRFKWTLPPRSRCPSLYFCVKFTAIIDTAKDSLAEFYMNNSDVRHNLQHGLYLENLRNYVIINSTNVINNGYGAGVRVFGGAGDILINSSRIEQNSDSGINITYDGGWRIFNWTSFSHNLGPGINITFNETSVDNYTRYTRIQKTHVSRSTFVANQGYGIQVGNYCLVGHAIAINDSYFSLNHLAAVQLFSCFRYLPFKNVSNFTVAYNKFDRNKEHAIKISPLINAVGIISNNSFSNHPKYVLLLDNTNDFLHNQFFLPLFTKYYVWGNYFLFNSGHYVANFRLTQGAFNQTLSVMYNYFINNSLNFAPDSEVKNSFTNFDYNYNPINNLKKYVDFNFNWGSLLNTNLKNIGSTFGKANNNNNSGTSNNLNNNFFPANYFEPKNKSIAYSINDRSRISSVVIFSSSNVIFSRNFLSNPNSRYELATQLKEMNIVLNASKQWWSTTNYSYIIEKIFDQYNRYNLAKINYHPALEQSWLYTPVLTDRSIPLEINFIRGNRIGGRLAVRTTLHKNQIYHVDRDVSVLVGGDLLIEPGVILKFENCLGMSIEGYAKWKGEENNKIKFESFDDVETWVNNSLIRLVGADNILEGRLQVRPSEEDPWGSICRKGWSVMNSIVSCRQMGLVADLDDWNFFPDIHSSFLNSPNEPIYRSFVQCEEFDEDILNCWGDGPEDHSCDHSLDVFLKCKLPSWAGIRFLGTTFPGVLEHIVIEGAGLDDPMTFFPVPALQIDYNTHNLNHLLIKNNRGSGLFIYHNDVTGDFKLRNSVVRENGKTGMVLKSPFFELYNCFFENNKEAGVLYDSSFTTEEALWIRTGVTRKDQVFYLTTNQTINLGYSEDLRWILTERSIFTGPKTFEVEINSQNYYKVHLDILDYNPLTEEEQVKIYDGSRDTIRPSTNFYSLPNDVIDFPLVSQLNSLTIRWTVTNISSGRLTFIARNKAFNRNNPWPFPTFKITNSTFKNNGIGLITKQYNQPFNEFADIFNRYKWTKIYIYDCLFENNTFESIYAPSISRYNLLYIPDFRVLEQTTKIVELHYELLRTTFKRNGRGIVSEHLNVEYSSNVWIWEINDCLFEENKGEGVSIYLPRVNLLDIDLFNHSVNVNGSKFQDNDNFQFRIDGFYCNSTFSKNIFKKNRCQIGCLLYSGTEKDFQIVDNQLTNNQVERYVIEIFMNSHTPFTQWVDARIEYNRIQNNRRLNPQKGTLSTPLTYSIGMFGLQNVTVNRNLMGFNELDAEFLAGQSSSILENYLDITYNYWGTVDQEKIQDLIFDFDDWNSFSIAEYHPFLYANSFESEAHKGPKYQAIMDFSRPLGGRISEDIVLKSRKEPYIVKSDITIMPGKKMVVEEGVTMIFHPNVGILSLGSLSLIGNYYNRIRLIPFTFNNISYVPPFQSDVGNIKIIHPDIDNVLGYQIKLSNVKNNLTNEGFIEIYNKTERKWALVCDDSFNERTAEVMCKNLKMESSNPKVFRSSFYDMFILGYPKMHEQLIEWYWRETLICDGGERRLEDCRRRINYALPDCMITRRYVYLRCGPRNLPSSMEYWGSIRVNLPTYESSRMSGDYVNLQYVDIYGGGLLHGKRSAALEGIFRTPDLHNVRIQNCYFNGIDYVAPINKFSLEENSIWNNNGYGIGIESLNGQSTEEIDSAFIPLIENRVPYDAFGLIRMCTVEKMVYVEDRTLIYHKYDFDKVDCIKIIRSKIPRKRIGIRFLQMNLFNDTMYQNVVEIYNSEFLEKNLLLARIDSHNVIGSFKRMYISDEHYDTISVRIKASVGYREYGFVAEVLTIPISGLWRPNFGLNQLQLIRKNLISGNEAGGFFFRNVGENNMRMSFENNHVINCGLRILNITNPGVVDIYIQNTKLMTISNNYIDNNAGGIFINTTTRDNQVAIYSNITNNVITRNTHSSALHIEGHRFQGFDVRYNYLAFNKVEHRNIFAAFGIELNFTDNIVYKNSGQCIMNASIEELVSISQQYMRNAIYYNWAWSFNRSTFFLKSAQFKISQNYLVNPLNHYEITMFNRTKYKNDELGFYPSVVATNNWWGMGVEAFVGGRVFERRDDDNLIQVDYFPYYKDNNSVLEGKCYPGWKKHGEKCYWYFGGVVPYHTAEKLCRQNRARLAWARDPTGKETSLGEIINFFQFNYNVKWRTWVYSDEIPENMKCACLENYVIVFVDCSLLHPFICEKTPVVKPQMDLLPVILAGVIAGCILTLVICPLTILSLLKSFKRKEEKVERKEMLKNSFRSARSTTPLSGEQDKHNYSRAFTISHNQHLNISGVTLGDSSTDTNNYKTKMNNSFSVLSSMVKLNDKLNYRTDEEDEKDDEKEWMKRKNSKAIENEIPSTLTKQDFEFDYKNNKHNFNNHISKKKITRINNNSNIKGLKNMKMATHSKYEYFNPNFMLFSEDSDDKANYCNDSNLPTSYFQRPFPFSNKQDFSSSILPPYKINFSTQSSLTGTSDLGVLVRTFSNNLKQKQKIPTKNTYKPKSPANNSLYNALSQDNKYDFSKNNNSDVSSEKTFTSNNRNIFTNFNVPSNNSCLNMRSRSLNNKSRNTNTNYYDNSNLNIVTNKNAFNNSKKARPPLGVTYI